MLACFILIIVSVLDGFKIAHSPVFVVVEFLLCLTISIDFALKARMVGFQKYMTMNCWNKLDFLIVIGCNILFIVSVVQSATVEAGLIEEILFIAWCVVQTLRMLIIARKQR